MGICSCSPRNTNGLSGCLAAPEDRAFPLAPSMPKAYPANPLHFVLDCWGQGTLPAAEASLLIEQFHANIFLNRKICNDCSESLEQSEVGHRGQCWLSWAPGRRGTEAEATAEQQGPEPPWPLGMVAWVPLGLEKSFPAGALRLWEVRGSFNLLCHPTILSLTPPSQGVPSP